MYNSALLKFIKIIELKRFIKTLQQGATFYSMTCLNITGLIITAFFVYNLMSSLI